MEDQIYRLEEMHEEMLKSISNAQEVLNSQIELTDVLENSDKAEHFVSFIESFKESSNNVQTQIDTMTERSAALERLLNICKENEEVKNAINSLVFALGIFASKND